MITDSELDEIIRTNFFSYLKFEGYEFNKLNDYVYQFQNGVSTVTIMIERSKEGFTAFFKESDREQQPIWKLYKEYGSPSIPIDETKDKLSRNLIWHADFIVNWLIKGNT